MDLYRCEHLSPPECGRAILDPHGHLHALCPACAYRLLDALLARFPPEIWTDALIAAGIFFGPARGGDSHDQ